MMNRQTSLIEKDMEYLISAISETFKKQGFWGMTKTDCTSRFKDKTDIDFKSYVILGMNAPAEARPDFPSGGGRIHPFTIAKNTERVEPPSHDPRTPN